MRTTRTIRRTALAVVLTFTAVGAGASTCPPGDVVRRLTAAIRKCCPDATIETNDEAFVARYRTMMFAIHGLSKKGDWSPETRQKEGPNYGGFLLSVALENGPYSGQAATPQVLRGPYFPTFIDTPTAEGGKRHYRVLFSYGGGLKSEIKQAVLQAVPRTRPGGAEQLLPATRSEAPQRPQGPYAADPPGGPHEAGPQPGIPATQKGRPWGPDRATGEPDTPEAGDRQTAWASQTQDDQNERLILDYADQVVPTEVRVYETYNPGALNKVSAFTEDGREVVLWAGKDPTAIGSGKGTSSIPLPPTALRFRTKRMKLYIASQAVPGWNEIDAVALVGRAADGTERVQWVTSATASSTYAEDAAGELGGDVDGLGGGKVENPLPSGVRSARRVYRRSPVEPSPDAPPTGVVANLVPLRLGSAIPLGVQSPGVAWKGNTLHLVSLGSIRFDLDKNYSLKADIQAGLTEFDDVDYDISGAVFDAAGQMLGAARAPCKVHRFWAGDVEVRAETIRLDFGVSSDYARAASFAVSVSNRRVLTPDEWQKEPAPSMSQGFWDQVRSGEVRNFMVDGFKVGVRPGSVWPVAANVYVPTARLEEVKQAREQLRPIIAARLAGLEKDDITQPERRERLEQMVLADVSRRLPRFSVRRVLLALDIQ